MIGSYILINNKSTRKGSVLRVLGGPASAGILCADQAQVRPADTPLATFPLEGVIFSAWSF